MHVCMYVCIHVVFQSIRMWCDHMKLILLTCPSYAEVFFFFATSFSSLYTEVGSKKVSNDVPKIRFNQIRPCLNKS